MIRETKVFFRSEKRLACDLRPGDLFVLEPPDPAVLDGDEVAMMVMMRTNVPDEEIEDRETIVYKLTVLVTAPERVTPAVVDPHTPPGMKEF